MHTMGPRSAGSVSVTPSLVSDQARLDEKYVQVVEILVPELDNVHRKERMFA